MDRRGTAVLPEGEPVSGFWDRTTDKLNKVQVATDSCHERIAALDENYRRTRAGILEEYSAKVAEILSDSTASETTTVISSISHMGEVR